MLTVRFGSSIVGPNDCVVTCVVMVTELSLASGSDSTAVIDAVLLSSPVDCGVTRMLAIAEPPFARLPKLHVMVVVPEQEPCVGLAEMKVTPGGSVSVNTALVAGDGPLLVTTILYVRLADTIAGFGDAVFVTARFALVAPNNERRKSVVLNIATGSADVQRVCAG